MLREYYYDKYSINTVWNTNPSGASASKKLFSNRFEEIENWVEQGYYDDWFCIYTKEGEDITGATCYPVDVYNFNSWTIMGYKNYELVNIPFNGMPNYRVKLIDYEEGFPKYGYGPTYWTGSDNIKIGLKTYGRGWGSGWQGESWAQMSIESVKKLVQYTAYEHKSRGTLLEEGLIRNETFPVNGIKNGFWWVRGKEYTIPAPVLISPANAFLVNVEEGETIPHLVFETTPRHVGETIKYHVRIRFGRTSDFINPDWVVDTRFDRTGVEVENPSTGAWEPFPADGVLGQRKVRYLPETTGLDFGFYYWDATQFHSFWGYGASANARMIIVITDSDDIYYLVINGRPYKATKLTTQESSNGEIGNINLEILNNNI